MDHNNTVGLITITTITSRFETFYNILKYGFIGTNFIAVFTNILVVATFCASWKFWRSSVLILLLTLACFDFVGNGISLMHYVLYPYSLYAFIYLYVCGLVFRTLSFLMMIPISANRYALVCRPLTHKVVTSKKSTIIQIATLTVLAFISFIVHFIVQQKLHNSIYNISILIIHITMCNFLPLFVTCVLTILVSREFRRINRTLEDSVRTGNASRQVERNVTKAMLSTNIAFIVLVLPATLCLFILIITRCHNCFIAYGFLSVVQEINCSINILIYTLYLPKFRSTLFGFLKYKCCKKRRSESIQMSAL